MTNRFFLILFALKNAPLRRHVQASILTGGAAVSCFVLNDIDSPADMLFFGGPLILLQNILTAALGICFLIFFPFIGRLLFREPPSDMALGLVDRVLMNAVSGTAVIVLLGLGLGVTGLLLPWLTEGLFLIVLYCGVLTWHLTAAKAWANRVLRPPMEPSARWPHRLLLLLLFQIAFIVLVIVVARGLLIDTHDGWELYLSYMGDIRRQGSIWPDADHPTLFSFLVGRGQGGYLFLTNFTGPYTFQIISVVYLLLMAGICERIFTRIRGFVRVSDTDIPYIQPIWSAWAILLSLASPLLYTEFSKYHFQTAIFVVFLCWASLIFCAVRHPAHRHWLYSRLLVVVVVVPLILPQYIMFVIMALVAATIMVPTADRRPAWGLTGRLLAASVAAFIVSMMLNQALVGIIELNPPFLFRPLANLPKLTQWVSPTFLDYLQNMQNIQTFSVNRFFEVLGYYFSSVRGVGMSLLAPTGPLAPLLIIILIASLPALVQRWRGSSDRTVALLAPGACSAIALLLIHFTFGVLLAAVVTQGSILRAVSYLSLYRDALIATVFLVLIGGLMRQSSVKTLRPDWWAWMAIGLVVATLGLAVAVTLSEPQTIPVLLQRGTDTPRAPVHNPTLAILWLFGGCGLAIALSGRPRWMVGCVNRTGVARILFLLVIGSTGVARVVDVIANRYQVPEQQQALAGDVEPIRAIRYAIGWTSLLAGDSREADFNECTKISDSLPFGGSIVPLNGLGVMRPCMNSPLLPRNRVVHFYEASLWRNIDVILNGPPNLVIEAFNRVGVRFFYFRPHDIYFLPIGASRLFREENLKKYFDVIYTGPDYYVLTWRGYGEHEVDDPVAKSVGEAYAESRKACKWCFVDTASGTRSPP